MRQLWCEGGEHLPKVSEMQGLASSAGGVATQAGALPQQVWDADGGAC